MKDFLIVADDVLTMPDCTLMIWSLSEREIEIHVDPKKQSILSLDSADADRKTEQSETVLTGVMDRQPG